MVGLDNLRNYLRKVTVPVIVEVEHRQQTEVLVTAGQPTVDLVEYVVAAGKIMEYMTATRMNITIKPNLIPPKIR